MTVECPIDPFRLESTGDLLLLATIAARADAAVELTGGRKCHRHLIYLLIANVESA